nr:reverse transcriptase domain-containing protein [Tanacetum cinerariifolium]
DSKLVANQVLGTYVAKEENMIKYLEKAKSLVLVEILKEKSIQEKEVATVVEEDGPTCMTPIMEYLKDETLPDDRKEASKLCINARQYEMLEGLLYRRSFLKLWLRKGQVFNNRCGLVYKVDRGKSLVTITDSQKPSYPRKIRMPTYRTEVVDAVHNNQELQLNLDLLEERRERVAIHEAKAKLKMKKYYNARVRGVTFRPGDFVYRSNDASHDVDREKLGPK